MPSPTHSCQGNLEHSLSETVQNSSSLSRVRTMKHYYVNGDAQLHTWMRESGSGSSSESDSTDGF